MELLYVLELVEIRQQPLALVVPQLPMALILFFQLLHQQVAVLVKVLVHLLAVQVVVQVAVQVVFQQP